MLKAVGILLAVMIVAGALGFWGVTGTLTAALLVIFWVALALLTTTVLVGVLGAGAAAFR